MHPTHFSSGMLMAASFSYVVHLGGLLLHCMSRRRFLSWIAGIESN